MLKHAQLMYHYLVSSRMNNILFMALLVVAAACVHVPESSPRPSVIISFCLAASLVYHYLVRRPNRVYLVDFACFKPGPSCLCTPEMLLERAQLVGFLSEENFKLVKKILDRSGLGPKTYVPEGLLHIPPKLTFDEARKETDTVLFGAVDVLLEKTGVQTKDIGILVVNCCLFNPTPSLSDTIVNHYKLRGNILTYDLSGMGCSAGVLAVDFAKQLLQVKLSYLHALRYVFIFTFIFAITNMYSKYPELFINKYFVSSNTVKRFSALI